MDVYAGENGAKKSYPFGVVNECHEAGKQGPPMPLTRSCLSALNVKGSLRKSICSALHVLNWRHVLAILRIRLICFQLVVRIRGASALPVARGTGFGGFSQCIKRGLPASWRSLTTPNGGAMRRADHMAPPFSFCRLFQAFLTRDVLDHARAVVGEHNAVTILRRVQVYIRHDAEVAVAV